MQICIPNIIDTVWNFVCANRVIIIGIASSPLVILGVRAMLKWLLSKPKIIIEDRFTFGYNPTRGIWQIEIYNEKLTGFFKYICKREKINCWIKAELIVDADEPLPCALWGQGLPNDITLEPDSNSYNIELISKIRGECGFYIKRPSPETRLIVEDALVVVSVKTGRDEIVKRAMWVIQNKGKQDLEVDRLE